MISEKDKQTIRKISREYRAKRVLLFGSGSSPYKKNRDIDIGVEGIPTEEFSRFYGDLMFELSKSWDVVDLSGDSKFVSMIKKRGSTVEWPLTRSESKPNLKGRRIFQ
jgi:predicted nucleotidyltransferase